MRTIHVSVNIDYLLDMSDDRLMSVIVPHEPMSSADVRRYLYQFKADGYEAIPSCDNHDEKGHCKGHGQLNSQQEGAPSS